MPLTPYPSLATLPEVIANGGKLPARSIDALSARTVYASSIPGVVLDCDLDTGLTTGGRTPTDNAAAINAVLAGATATTPVHLIIDGGSAIGGPILIPPTGYVQITGLGWHTGFHVLPGSNCNAIQNFPHTDYATAYVWAGLPGWATTASNTHPGVAGENVFLSNFRVNGNRGTYPNGNSNGHNDGTVTNNSSPPDARGPYSEGFWLSGIILANLNNIHVEKVWAYNAPTYHINLYNCTRVWIDRCRVEVADPTVKGNQDGIHINGGCSEVFITRCWISSGDDPIAFNTREGNGGVGVDLSADDITLFNCLTAGRMYGPSGQGRRVSFRNIRGTVQLRGIVVGDEGYSANQADSMHSMIFENIDVQVTDPSYSDVSLISLCANAGLIEVKNCKLIEQAVACPLVRVGNSGTAPIISSLRISDCEIHRNSVASAGAYLLLAESGSIGELLVDGFRYTEQYAQSYVDVASLISLTNSSAINRLGLSGVVNGVGAVLSVGSSASVANVDIGNLAHKSHAGSPTAYTIVNASSATIPVDVGQFRGINLAGLASGPVALTGPGLVSSGLSFADSLMADNSIYNSATQSALVYKDGSGTVNVFSFGSAPPATAYSFTGPTSGAVGAASTNFTIRPNGPYTGTITVTPSGGGLSSPIVLTFSSSSSPQTFTIAPISAGAVTVTPTNGGSLTNPSPLTYTAASHVTSAGLFTASANSGQGTPLSHASTSHLQGGPSAWTIGCYYRPTDNTVLTSRLQPLLSKWASSKEYILFTENTSPPVLGFAIRNGSTEYDYSGTVALTVNTDYWVALVFDGKTGHIFINGVEDGSGIAATPGTTSDAFYIGGDGTGSGFQTSGRIGQVYKYPFALSGAQLAWMYNGGLGRGSAEILAESGLTTPDLLVCFENSSDLGHDSSANAYDLTPTYAGGPTQISVPS